VGLPAGDGSIQRELIMPVENDLFP
jgi:hypothetical protein